MPPSISVIIPVFNIENYINKCIDSVLSQTFRDFELILIDDGSTDQSGKICDNYANRYPDIIKVWHTENAGQGSARNTGVRFATGKYLQFVDGDDFIDCDMLEKMFEMAEKSGFPDMVVCGIKVLNNEGVVTSILKENLTPTQRLEGDAVKDLLLIYPSPCNRIIRRDFYISCNVEFPAGVWYEDVRVTVKLSALTQSAAYVDKPFYNYYTRIGSSTKNTNCDRMRELIWAFEDILSFFKKNGLFMPFYERLEFLAIRHLYIAGSVRVIRIEKSNPLLNNIALFMHENFPGYRKNPYLPRLSINKKIVFHLLNLKMYYAIFILFKLNN
ncbi:MAG: glycosyltransferase [Oscillospiraceae bacterium]|nr:glycosyltransferase [Oscillospiraceae bacterium]